MRLSPRVRAQDGFTVVELLVAMIVLSMVVAGSLTLIQVVMRQGRGVLERTEAAQNGRLALDRMTRQIRSQVCRDQFTGGLISASPTELRFYADLGDGRTAGPSMHALKFDSATGRITEKVWFSQTVPPAAPSYPVAPNRELVILQDVAPETTQSGTALPFFSYFAYDTAVSPPVPNRALQSTGPLSATDLPDAAVVRLQFKVRPTGARDDKFAVRMQDDVFFRNADPNAARPEPRCN
jgi:prepilin-type N-terminal cleavage/methylation domain-containing protein